MKRILLVAAFLGGLLLSFGSFGQAAGDFRSFTSGVWGDVNNWERYDGSVWVNPAPNVPTSTDGLVTIQGGHAMNIAGTQSVSSLTLTAASNTSLTIDAGGSLMFIGTLTLGNPFPGRGILYVNGTLIANEGSTITGPSNKLVVNSGGIYRHNYSTTPGTIFTATWNPGSTLEIAGYTTNSSPPLGLAQTFENFVWNCINQTSDIYLEGDIVGINGDFRLLAPTNFNIIGLTVGNDYTLEIGGELFIASGIYLDLSGGAGNATLNLGGNLTINSDDGLAYSGTGSATFVFSGSGEQIINNQYDNTFSPIDFVIPNGAIVSIPGNNYLSTVGSFSLNSGGTLKIGSPNGIVADGSAGGIRVSGTRNYAANSNIVYNGTAAQVLGDEWSASGALNGIAVNLEIDNTNGVTNDIIGGASLVGDLTLTNGALHIGNSNSLDVQSNFIVVNGTIGGLNTSNLTFSGSGTLGTLTMASGAQELNNLTITRAGDLVLGSPLTLVGTLALTGNLDFSGQSLTINGTSIDGTGGGGLKSNSTSNLTIGGSGFNGAIPYAGTGNQLNNLTLNSTGGANYTWNSAVTINNTLDLSFGTLDHSSGLTMGTGSTVIKGSGSLTTSALGVVTSYNLTYTAAGNTGLEMPTSTTALNTLTVAVSGTVALQNAAKVNGDLILTSGTLDAGANNFEVAGANWTANGGTFTIGSGNNTVTLSSAGTLTMGGTSIGGTQFGSLIINSGTTVSAPNANLNVAGTWNNQGVFTPNNGTITFNGANQNINPAGQPFNNVTFAGTGTKTLQGALDANGTLTISSTLDVGANQSINVAGSWVNSGTFVPGGGTVTFDGTSQTITSNGQPFFNLALAGSGTKTLGDALDVNGNLSIGNAITLDVSVNAYAINLAGNWTNDGTFSAGTGTVTFDGTTAIGGTGTTDFNSITVAGDLTAPAATMNVAGNWLFNSGSFTHNSGTINFNGGVNQAITSGGQAFNNVTISGLNTKTLQDNIDINGNLTLSAATLDVGADRQINLAGNFDASGGGSFTAGAGLLVLDGTTQAVDGGGVAFNDLQLNATTTATFSGNLELTGNWLAQTGASFSGAGTVSFVGAGTHSITSNGGAFNNVVIGGTGSATLQDAFDVNGDLTISSSLSAGANAITVAGNWDSGTGTFTAGTGSVTLDGGAQNITSGANSFNNITLAGTGTKTLQDAFDVNGSLTISSGLDVGASQPITLVGDWTNDGTFTAAAGKVTFDGNGTSNVLGTSTTVFNDIDVTGTTNVEIETTHSLTGTLALVGASSAFDADGSGNAGVFTLVSSSDNPATDGNIAALTTPANFTGDVTVQRYMASEGGIWRYLTTPVSGLTVADWQGEFPITGNFTGADDLGGANLPSLYIYNEANTGIADSGWVAYPATANTEAINPGVGYSAFIRASAGQTTVNQRGPVNKGSFNFSVSYTVGQGATHDGWNLLGNPYPSALDWDLLWTNGSSNINPTIYIKDNGGGGGVFASYNASTNSGANGGTKNIAQGQSFWVQANGASPSLAATESMKTTDAHQFFRLAPPVNFIRIAVSDGTDRDETLIHFFDDALPGKDKYDAYKIKNDIFNLSSLMDDGSEMVINAIGSSACDTQVNLKIANISAGNYTLDFSELDSFEEMVSVYLTDNYTGSYQLISNGYQYPFTVTADSASFGAQRFVVTFDKPDINTGLVVAGTNVCELEMANITLEGSEPGVNYFALLNGVGVTDTVAGTGNDLMLVIQDSLATGTYEYTIMANNGCGEVPLTNRAVVEVAGIYAVTQVVGDQSCGPNTLTLKAAGAPDTGGYRWYNNLDDALPLAETTVGEFVTPAINESKMFYVAVYNQLGCEGDRMPIEATIINLEIPTITLDSMSLGVYSLVSSYASGNQWHLYGEPIEGATSNTYLMTEPGVYSVVVEQSGCTVTSDSYNYEDLILGLDDELNSLITVAPNPFTTSFELHLPAEAFNLRKTVITIYDISGKVVYFDKKIRNENISINLGSFNNGIYLMNIYDGETGTQYKLIKE